MWPAFTNHFVHPNLSKTPRISVSFNTVLRPKNEQLPDIRPGAPNRRQSDPTGRGDEN